MPKKPAAIKQLVDYEYGEKFLLQKLKNRISLGFSGLKRLLNLTKLRRWWKQLIRQPSKPEKPSHLVLTKYESNPILSPKEENFWESWQVFNPGGLLIGDKVHLIYRSIGADGLSRLGYASSESGLDNFARLSYPIYEHSLRTGPSHHHYNGSGGSWGGCEDPRLIRVKGDSKIYMLYTACDYGLKVALTSIELKDFVKGKWKWAPPKVISPPGEVHKNWVIFPEKINGKYAILTTLTPEISIEYRDSLDFGEDDFITSSFGGKSMRTNVWDNWIRGAGPPPIKTKYGWLLLYHAIDAADPSKYKVGAKLLDLEDPTKVLFRSKKPVLEPDEHYENSGFKAGIVYASGAVVKDGILMIYYGGSDSYVCVAYVKLDKFLDTLVKDRKPNFIKRILKRTAK